MQELEGLKTAIKNYNALYSKLEDAEVYLDLAGEDESVMGDLESSLDGLDADADRMEVETLLSGEFDHCDAILSIHSGAGGTDAQDWAEMLLRMYTRWIEKHGFSLEVADHSPGEEAGLKSATLFVGGKNAFGMIKAEKGVHRLVRLSPFDSAHRRHTSFAQVDVMPEIEEAAEIKINPEDLRIDTYRSSGAGGQHVNKTDSAVRITHVPTGIVVTCQNERSQHSNRLTAMRILKAKLFELQQEENRKKVEELRGAHKEIAWGSQIRSYVLHPYSMVKDHRTGFEKGDVQRVLDGDIDGFIKAYLEEIIK